MMNRTLAILGSAVFLVIAPGTLAAYVPYRISQWHMGPHLLNWQGFQWMGAIATTLGLPILLECFGRFAMQGLGTPAPIAPPQHLVVKGLYRYVRNPMYVAVSLLIFGQGLLFGNVTILQYGAIVFAGFHLFVILYEEPALHRKFGKDYELYCENVRRWRPRFRRW